MSCKMPQTGLLAMMLYICFFNYYYYYYYYCYYCCRGCDEMGNIVPRVGIEPTSLACWASVLPLHHVCVAYVMHMPHIPINGFSPSPTPYLPRSLPDGHNSPNSANSLPHGTAFGDAHTVRPRDWKLLKTTWQNLRKLSTATKKRKKKTNNNNNNIALPFSLVGNLSPPPHSIDALISDVTEPRNFFTIH